MPKSNASLAMFLMVLLSIIWGSAYWFIKKALGVVSPMELGMLRMSVATVVLLPFALKDFGKLERRDIPKLILIGLTGNLAPAVLFPLAQQVISSAEAGVLNALSPLFILAVSFFIFGQRYPWVNVAGIFVGLTGALILIVGSAGGNISFDGKVGYALFVVAATVCYGISANMVKQFFGHYPPQRLTAFSISVVGIPTMLYMLLGTDVMHHVSTAPGGWKAFGFVAILGAIMTALAVMLFYRMIQVSSLVYASMVTYTAPIIVTLIAVLDHETLGWPHVVGMMVILVGVFLVNLKPKKAADKS